MEKLFKSNLLKFFLILCFFVIFFSSVVNIYEKRSKIIGFIKAKSTPDKYTYSYSQHNIAKNILKGGYILFFRHGEREKWIDVKMYDSFEAKHDLKAEKLYFSKAVCLNSRGLIQTEMMGSIWKELNIPYHTVITSPSCRARQTAERVFGGYNQVKNIFMHFGPYFETNEEFISEVKNEILKIPQKENSNIIISAHNGVIRSTDIFDEIRTQRDFSQIAKKFMEEGGFIVMKNENNKLVFIDVFFTFHDFQLQFQKRPVD